MYMYRLHVICMMNNCEHDILYTCIMHAEWELQVLPDESSATLEARLAASSKSLSLSSDESLPSSSSEPSLRS